jgi:hypothetical protein
MLKWVKLHGTILKLLDLMCERYGNLNNFCHWKFKIAQDIKFEWKFYFNLKFLNV